MDPVEVLADLESQQEKTEDRREFWRQFLSSGRADTNTTPETTTAPDQQEPSKEMVVEHGTEPATTVRCEW